MRFVTRLFTVLFGVSLALGSVPCAAAGETASGYAVLSLVGKALHIYSVRPEVGTRTRAENHQVLALAESTFDETALKAAYAHLRQADPGARVVLMTSQDAGLFRAQNTMFDEPDAHKSDRDYLIGLLKERKVNRLLLVTTQRDNARFKLVNGMWGTGQLEGLGFYLDDTSPLRDEKSLDQSTGMLGPFAYIRVRLLDASTLAVIGEATATKSSIIIRPAATPNALEVWTSVSAEQKSEAINNLLRDAIGEALASLVKQA